MTQELIPVSDRVILIISTVGFLVIGIGWYAIFSSTDTDVPKVRRRRGGGVFGIRAIVFGHRDEETLVDQETEEDGMELATNETRAQRRAKDRLLRRRRGHGRRGGDTNDTLREEHEVDNYGDRGGGETAQSPMIEREQRRRFDQERRQVLEQKKNVGEEFKNKDWLDPKKVAAQLNRRQEVPKLNASRNTSVKIVASRTSSSPQEDMIYTYNNPDFLDKFVRYLKDHKVVPITDFGRSFNNMSTTETLNVIAKLEEMGHINGIVDPYGNYIYVDSEEIDRILMHIHLSGKVSTSELSNMITTLYGDTPCPNNL